MFRSFKSFTIREGELFTHQKDLIEPDAKRMDEVLFGVMWALGRDPTQFANVRGRLWIAKTDPYPGAPRLRIWFKLEGMLVELLSIELIENPDE
jgi:hypothetical protein